MKFKKNIKHFFFPPAGSPRWMLVLPYSILGILTLLLLIGGAYGWDYTNSPTFCGTVCHTMPPEYAAYQVSPHARIACVECHIGREFIGNQIFRKAGDIRHIVSLAFKTYEYPITADKMRPARESCERCHAPEKFSDDSLRVITHYKNDKNNTPYNIYLILKTGGGSKRQGLGRGIHWHIENKVFYYPEDKEEQTIPYVRVVNDNGTTDEYVDVQANFNPSTMDESQLKEMDCITCHNRITHHIFTPAGSMDIALSQGSVSRDIPDIHRKGVEILQGDYATQDEGLRRINNLIDYYSDQYPDYYKNNNEKVQAAVDYLQEVYMQSVFIHQKVDWNTHPNNIGHVNFPGCFRCHDGKHLNTEQQAIRLECNLCHSIPITTKPDDFVTKIEISRGPEPKSHLNSNWIALHNQAFDGTCSNCHTTSDPGSTNNTSFCSNSACHGSVFTFAGFDALKLREILQTQLPTPTPVPVPAPVVGNPTYEANIQIIFNNRCAMCHGTTASAGLNVTDYADLMKGSMNGPVITIGDSASSKLIQVQIAQHFANLSIEELEIVKLWIDAGAPEK